MTRGPILVVDDEPDFRTYISMVLEDNGFETVTADDGEEGWHKAMAIRPILITLDITMPNKSGVRLYREMRESEALRDTPIVICTGMADDFKKFISTRSQVPPPDGYIPKPIDRDTLLETVARLLG